MRIGKKIASGLALAHESGMIHRDIKPDNIWLDEKTDRAKILDFRLVSASADDEELTHSGAVLGRAPFSGNNFTSTLIAVAHQPPVPLQQAAPELHADVAAAIMQLLEKEPDHRPQSAEAVVHQFHELADKLKRIQPNLDDTVTQTSELSSIVTQTSGLSPFPHNHSPEVCATYPPPHPTADHPIAAGRC